jgi:hypothetical protein
MDPYRKKQKSSRAENPLDVSLPNLSSVRGSKKKFRNAPDLAIPNYNEPQPPPSAFTTRHNQSRNKKPSFITVTPGRIKTKPTPTKVVMSKSKLIRIDESMVKFDEKLNKLEQNLANLDAN